MRLAMSLSSNLSDQEAAALQAYVTALQERFGHQLVDVLLFGSKARGEAHPDADVDVAVILDHPDAQDLSDARGLAFDIWLNYQVFLSIRAISQEHWQILAAMQSLFYRNLLRDGISCLPAPA
jgi:predicted nucleotidyltransferase